MNPIRSHLSLHGFICLTAALATSAARADHASLQIAVTTGPHPQLILRGPPDLLNGTQPIDLLPGDARFAGQWLHDEPSFHTIDLAEAPNSTSKSSQPRPAPRFGSLAPNHRVALRRLAMSTGLTLNLPSTLSPILKADGDTFEFIHDSQGFFGINLLTSADHAGTFSATLQLVDLAGRYVASKPFTLQFRTVSVPASAPAGPARYICPMRCENEKAYPAPGRCPDCKMKLADINAHQDHRPRHKGQFFMAPNQTHHFEGVRVSPTEFRIYFYDEYTQPLSADAFKISARTQRDTSTPPASAPASQPAVIFQCNDSREYQRAALNAELPGTARLKTWIDFQDGSAPQPFEFDLNSPATPDIAVQPECRAFW